MEQYSKILKLIENDTLSCIQEKSVVIVGIGGVGGYALEMLCRFGLKKITIIDADVVDVSNLNRQVIALHSNIGVSKVEIAKKRILDINPSCQVTDICVFLNANNINDYIPKNVDYIIDCCDTVTTKMELIKYAKKNNIPVISSMGTGNRLDATKLMITDIYKTKNDPLAKVMRKLCKENNIKHLDVLVSSELQIKTHDRTPGSTPFVPSTAGIYIANYIVRKWLQN